MKKYIALLILGAGLLHAETVFFSENGSTYHKDEKCFAMRRIKEPFKAERAEAEKHGLRPCSNCYREHAVNKTGRKAKNAWAAAK